MWIYLRNMKKIKVEIQVTFLTIIIAAAMVGSGYLVYNSLSSIIDSIHGESRPDTRLLLIKDIAADLTEVENHVRLYSLTGDSKYLDGYSELNSTVQQKLLELKDYGTAGPDESQLIDSIGLLSQEKLLLWDKIRSLHRQKGKAQQPFTQLYSRIDTAIVPFDTIQVKAPEEKKEGFFKRITAIFGKSGKKSSTPAAPIIIDKSEEKENIKQEIATIERKMTDQTRRFQVQEKYLVEQNMWITSRLMKQVGTLEYREQRRLETKTQEADFMAAQTYRRLTVFTLTTVVLLLAVLFIFIRNIQKSKNYQQILKKARTEAENLAKAKEMFVATVSHEMRTPINAIYGLTEQLLQKVQDPETAADLKIVHTSTEHLISLVNDTLDFSKIEAQKLKIEEIDFLPEEVFREVYILNKNAAAAKGVELTVKELPEAGLALKGDPIRLKQILINLVSNALKFTSSGRVQMKPQLIKEEELVWLKTEVIDTGIGISDEDAEKIFDEFVQLDNDLTQKHRGAGLGLSIVRKLVELQGGRISLKSTPGKGSCFTVEIPYQNGDPLKVPSRTIEKLRIPPHLKDLRFLLVDDEAFNRYLLKNILSKWGVSYIEAANGKTAVELAQKNNFDLIFMDLRMPVLNGFETSRLILTQKPGTRIIALTAANNPDDIQKSREAGMLDFLQKPFSEAALLKLIEGLFPEKRSSPAIPSAAGEHVNTGDLERISGNDKAFVSEMIRVFIRSCNDGLENMKAGLRSHNGQAIAEAAHKLAAPAKHMQAKYLYDKLKTLETEAPVIENLPEIPQIVEEVEAEIRQITGILKKKLEN